MKKLMGSVFIAMSAQAIVPGLLVAKSHPNSVLLPTPDPRVTCSVRQLTENEIEELYFNKETWRFQQHFNVLLDSTNAILNDGKSHGFAQYSIANETAHQINMKDMANVFQPVKVVIKNNSDQPITIQRSGYILAYAQALTTTERLAALYPNFGGKRAGLIAAGVVSSVFCGVFGILALLALFAVFQNKGRLIFPGFVVGGGSACLGFLASLHFKGARWAARLRDKVERLQAISPKLSENGQKPHRLSCATSYTIPAGGEFYDVLILNMPSLNSSSSLFGQSKVEPKLDYTVGGPNNVTQGDAVKLW